MAHEGELEPNQSDIRAIVAQEYPAVSWINHLSEYPIAARYAQERFGLDLLEDAADVALGWHHGSLGVAQSEQQPKMIQEIANTVQGYIDTQPPEPGVPLDGYIMAAAFENAPPDVASIDLYGTMFKGTSTRHQINLEETLTWVRIFADVFADNLNPPDRIEKIRSRLSFIEDQIRHRRGASQRGA
ncbi:hypothetical protein HYZ64_01265 [Candidatus Berkelbacteria bacterium]|nr:hypothetical protein [Candidatus Berkelbacteria bacterium]